MADQQEDTQKLGVDNVADSGKHEDTSGSSKKRKMEPSSAPEHIHAFPLVCCDVRQTRATEDTDLQVYKRQRRQSEIIEGRAWYLMQQVPSPQPTEAGRSTPNAPTTNYQIARLIHPEDHHLISQIYLPLKPKPDSHIWSPTKDGNYTVKSSYWTAMNLLIDNDTPQPRLAHFPDISTISDTKEWLDNATKTTTRHNSGPIKDAREAGWRKPPRGVMKCNYDVSHHGGNRVSGLGWIIRDSFGTFHDCGWGKSQGCTTTEEAECTSLIWALQATWGLGYRMVEFEGDNQNINNIINGTAPHPRLQHYIDTIWAWRDLFTQATFTFKPREQNKCADILAKKAISSDERWGLYHSCPHFLNSPVKNDIDPKY
ncbi:hypothetical protein ARALYDRAFT_347512 [Arabidopsis lyrata subsp. lyrata]|uniref:RNase H type-1 domain-containing protein n=1 Tax=Arabidopsis lyrata subsp. lyrata TaxID=81972 RepID=D7LNQ7_ARALL|nr:hypothetical protein ARALYDRAFT_347512 [Arabidopsis lyrata subsp. lyrata]